MSVDVSAEVIDSSLATRRDIKAIRRDSEAQGEATKRDIKELEQRMVIKPGSLSLVAVGAAVALSNLNFYLKPPYWQFTGNFR